VPTIVAIYYYYYYYYYYYITSNATNYHHSSASSSQSEPTDLLSSPLQYTEQYHNPMDPLQILSSHIAWDLLTMRYRYHNSE